MNLSKSRTVVEAMLEDYEFNKLYIISFMNELKEFRHDTNRNFVKMAEKYGDIWKELKEFRKSVKGFLDAFLSEYQKRTSNP